MGYKPQRKIYKLIFADEEYEGLEVMARSVSLGALLEFRTLASNATRNKFTVPDGATPEEIVAAAEAAGVDTDDALGAFLLLVEKFAQVLVSWNVEEEEPDPADESKMIDVPTPANMAGLLDQEPTFVMKIVETWVEVVAGVDTPLPRSSNSGETSVEESMAMVPMLESPQS